MHPEGANLSTTRGPTRCWSHQVRSTRHGGRPARPGPALDTAGTAGERGEAYLRMLTARAITKAKVSKATAACTSISIFAHRERGMTSVGLKAVALVNDKYR